jgi:hypothetical protein
MEAITQISKEGLGSQATCGRVSNPAGAPGRVMYEAVRVKPKLQRDFSLA